jgi:hypothetical protein
MRLTNIEAANRQLCTAIHMFFEAGDPVCIHALACNAREIYERKCKDQGINRFFDYAMEAFPDTPEKELWNVINKARNFFKHSLNPPDDVIEFSETYNRPVAKAGAFAALCR